MPGLLYSDYTLEHRLGCAQKSIRENNAGSNTHTVFEEYKGVLVYWTHMVAITGLIVADHRKQGLRNFLCGKRAQAGKLRSRDVSEGGLEYEIRIQDLGGHDTFSYMLSRTGWAFRELEINPKQTVTSYYNPCRPAILKNCI